MQESDWKHDIMGNKTHMNWHHSWMFPTAFQNNYETFPEICQFLYFLLEMSYLQLYFLFRILQETSLLSLRVNMEQKAFNDIYQILKKYKLTVLRNLLCDDANCTRSERDVIHFTT